MSLLFSEVFPSNYLKASDLNGRRKSLIIHKVLMEEIGEDGTKKPVIEFDNTDKRLVLNKTNGSVIAEAYGDEMDKWTGKPIELFPSKVQFSGRLVDAIRVSIPDFDVDVPL
jgi:hypothetical protein